MCGFGVKYTKKRIITVIISSVFNNFKSIEYFFPRLFWVVPLYYNTVGECTCTAVYVYARSGQTYQRGMDTTAGPSPVVNLNDINAGDKVNGGFHYKIT